MGRGRLEVCVLVTREESSPLVAVEGGLSLPLKHSGAHCNRHSLCLCRKSLTVCKYFSSLDSYFYSATKHVSEVYRSFDYKGFSVVPLNPLAMSSAFRWLCSLQ